MQIPCFHTQLEQSLNPMLRDHTFLFIPVNRKTTGHQESLSVLLCALFPCWVGSSMEWVRRTGRKVKYVSAFSQDYFSCVSFIYQIQNNIPYNPVPHPPRVSQLPNLYGAGINSHGFKNELLAALLHLLLLIKFCSLTVWYTAQQLLSLHSILSPSHLTLLFPTNPFLTIRILFLFCSPLHLTRAICVATSLELSGGLCERIS